MGMEKKEELEIIKRSIKRYINSKIYNRKESFGAVMELIEGNALKRISYLQNWDWAVNFNSVTLKGEKITLAEEKLRSKKKEQGIFKFSHPGKRTQDCPGWKENSDASVSSSYRNQNQRKERDRRK